MRRILALATAVTFAVSSPAFAQSAAPVSTAPSQAAGGQSADQSQSLLLDGQDAYAQQDPNNPNGNPGGIPTGILVAGGVLIIGGVVVGIAASRKNSAVSP